MSTLNKIPFYTFLLAVFFCLHGVSENVGYISFYEAATTCLVILLSISLLYSIIYLFRRNIQYAGIVTFFLSVLYLFFGAIQDNVKNIPFIRSYIGLLLLMLIVSSAVILYFRKKSIKWPKWTLYLNILLIIYCMVDTTTIFIKLPATQATTPAAEAFNIDISSIKQKPNVYFLLFDEYPGYKSLKDSFNFKNDALYKKLRADSYTIMPVFSNYSMTSLSMSSLLNMQYIKGLDLAKVGQKEIQLRLKEIKNGQVFKLFSQLGYKISSYSIFDVMDKESLGGNSFILGHSRLLTDKIFHNRFIKDARWIFLKGRFAIPAFQRLYFGDILSYNERVELGLMEALAHNNQTPQFVYAHFLLPHQPYFYDSAGIKQQVTHLQDDTVLKNKSLFISYLKYTNKKIEAYSDSIIKTDPTALIIIMSDHGFRDYNSSKTYEPFNFDNFCAIYYKAAKPSAYYAQISNVNVFRLVLNEFYHQNMPYLKDQIGVLKEIKNPN